MFDIPIKIIYGNIYFYIRLSKIFSNMTFENEVIDLLKDIRSELQSGNTPSGNSSSGNNRNGNNSSPKLLENIWQVRRGNKYNDLKKEYENAKNNGNITKANQIMKQMADIKTNMINKSVQNLSNIIQQVGIIIQSGIQKNINNTEALYNSANVKLEKNLEILTNSIKLGSTALSSAFTSSSQFLVGKISQGASAAVDTFSSTMLEAEKTSRQKALLELQRNNKLELIERQRQIKNQAETNKQINAGAEATAIAIGVAVNAIPAIGQVASAAILGGVALAKGITAISLSINQAKDEAELKRLEQEKSYLEKQQEAYNKLVDSLQESARQQLMAAKNIVEPMVKAAKEYDDIFRKSAVELGLSGKNISNYVKNSIDNSEKFLLDASRNLYLDWSVQQQAKFQQGYSEKTGFAVSLTSHDQLMAGAIAKVWDENDVNEMAATMQLYNHSVSDSVNMMGEMYNLARQNGLSQSKFSKELAKNLKLAEKHQFKGGVKGLMEMTAWAQKMRFNMVEFGSVLNKIKDGGLEGVIEQAANLQVLGGNFAMGSDPLAMLWETYNNPQALGKRLHGMVRGMGTYNDKTGEVDFNMHDQLMLQSMAKATGQSVESLMNMSRQNVKRKYLESAITNGKYSDVQKELIYAKATKDSDGKWKINGKDINELEAADFAELEDTNKGILEHVKDIQSMMASERGLEQRNQTKFVSENFDKVQQNFSSMLQTVKLFGDESGNFGGLVTEYLDYQVDAVKQQNKTSLEQTETMIHAIQVIKDLQNSEVVKQGFDDMNEGFKALLTGRTSEYARSKGIETDYFNDVKNKYEAALKDYEDGLGHGKDVLNDKLDKLLITYQSGNLEEAKNILADGVNDLLDSMHNSHVRDTDSKDGINMMHIEYLLRAANKLKVDDGLLSSNGSSMLTAASNVTPIHDGSVQLAKSDPKDSAIFAKTGGPFDTLFNGIFAKINEVSEILPKSMLYNMPIDIRKSLSESLSHSKDTTNNSYNQTNPIKIELNGKLELTNSNGQSVDIINAIKNNPMLLRQLTELISQSINENIYGGRTTFNAGVTTSRYKPL